MGTGEDIYCAEQITIPPTFPYLLRQYAKAAIRTQPLDLLKWSATYFRCLSLNCPAPVKTRLEYPIPEDWYGLTPGWVKSLHHQIHPSATIDYKTLWNRWMGSCLQNDKLLQLLSLGGFTEPHAIPWLKFIGLCTATISKSLTQTMINVCEILTDEPEGASASVPLENFLTIYKFLADIDASKPQVIRQKYFLDSLLALWKEKKKKFEEAVEASEESEEEEIISEKETAVVEAEALEDFDLKKDVSCPSIKSDDYKNIEEYLAAQEKMLKGEDEETHEDEEQEVKQKESKESTVELIEFTKDQPERRVPDFEEQGLLEDLAKLRALQEEMKGEDDDRELEEYKRQLMIQLQKSPSELEAISHFATKLLGQEEKVLTVIEGEGSDGKSSDSVELRTKGSEENEEEYVDVLCEEIPGIGPKVPIEIVQLVEQHMREMAKYQSGMIMPRNIRHYECPPLEVIDDFQKELSFLDKTQEKE